MMVVKVLRVLFFMQLIILVLFPRKCLCARSEFSKPDGKERDLPNVISLVVRWGFPIEPHTVVTEDGYILQLFRIPRKDSLKNPVYVQHGLVSCGASFLANKKSLVYRLFEEGYDVWVGNARGTDFSHNHKWLDTNSEEFWNFSFHEMGLYDIPANLLYITKQSGKSKVHYIGHSMGTTMFLVMASLRPEKLDIVDSVTFLAPVAVPKHVTVFMSSFNWNLAHFTTKNLPRMGYAKHDSQVWLGKIKLVDCNTDSWFGRLCRKVLGTEQLYLDYNELMETRNVKYRDRDAVYPEETRNGIIEVERVHVRSNMFDRENAEQVFQYSFHGTSWKTHRHFLQIIKAGKFQMFDYENKNHIQYPGKTKPYRYPLRKIKKRIYLISGGLDTVALPEDVKWLHLHLPGSWLIEENFEEFDHTTFNQGVGIYQVLYTVQSIIEAAERGVDPDTPRTGIKPPTGQVSNSDESDEDDPPPKWIDSKIASFHRNQANRS